MNNYNKNDNEEHTGRTIALVAAIIICLALAFWLVLGSWATVSPGNRGVKVTLGSVDPTPLEEGFHLKAPMISRIDEVSVRMTRASCKAMCYSSDLQQVTAQLAVMYSIPKLNVIRIYKDYAGDPFIQFVQPLTQEAFKEVTATRSAERIVKERESIKAEALAALRKKIGDMLTINDIAIENLDLSDQLEKAIEQKMVQEQEAARAKFRQEQARTDAETAKIVAEGEASAIKIRGDALKENPDLVQLQIVEKWDGHCPQTIVTSSGGASILLPVK